MFDDELSYVYQEAEGKLRKATLDFIEENKHTINFLGSYAEEIVSEEVFEFLHEELLEKKPSKTDDLDIWQMETEKVKRLYENIKNSYHWRYINE
jgi:hypothetical protein